MGLGTGAAADAREIDRSPWLDHGVRLGLVVYGIVHLIIAVTALQLAFGDQSGNASQHGAFTQLSQSPLGDAALVLVAAGLLGLVVWQLIEAAVGHRRDDGGKRALERLGSVGKAVVYGVLAVSAGQKVFSSGSGKSTDSTTAQLMSAPGGQFLVGAVGLGVVAVGAYLGYRGWAEKFTKDLDVKANSGRRREPIVLLGKVGYLGKGVALAGVGGLFLTAAVQHQAKESGGLDVALHELLRQPFGVWLVVAVALGIGCFGLYCLAWARHLDR
jgi:hypothetical protein